MPAAGNDWMKLYTSLLGHDGFAGLDDAARMLIVSLWMYAARSGLYILPADPKWIWRKIPMLNSEPDIEPLITTQDAYGKPTPFLAYCQPPGQVDTDRSEAEAEQPAKKVTKKKKRRPGTTVATRTRGAQRDRKRVESREKRREKIEDVTLAGYEREKERKKKERVNSAVRKERGRTEKTETEASEPEKPENPNESEVGPANGHHVPKPARSATRGPQSIGSVISDRFPQHWLDPDCEAFGWKIVEALGMPHDEHNMQIRSEWGSFASFWFDVKQYASTMLHDDIRRVAVNKALFVSSNKAKSARNKPAVWRHIMDGELAKRGVRIPKKRAGP